MRAGSITIGARPIPARRFFEAGVVLLVLASPIVVAPVVDPDLWGHLRFGLDMLRTHALARTDPYSYTAFGRPWIDQEWLAELILAAAYSLAGTAGLALLRLGLCIALLAVCYRCLLARGLPLVQAGALVLLYSIPMSIGTIEIRPQLFTYLLFLAVWLVLEQAERGRPRALWFLPPLFALWANLHGGFLAGAAVVTAWAALHILLDPSRHEGLLRGPGAALSAARAIAAPLALALAATCFNPYSVQLPFFLLRTAAMPRPETADWQPLQIGSAAGLAYLATLAVSLLGIIRTRRRRSPVMIILFGAMVLAPLIAIRHLPLFALAALAVAGEHVQDAWDQVRPRRGGASYTLPLSLLPLLSVLLVVGLKYDNATGLAVNSKQYAFPAAAVALLKESGVSGNLAVSYNWGEYVIWQLGPGIKVSVDGRREMVYDAAAYVPNMLFEFGVGGWDTLLTMYPTDMALVSKDEAAYNLMSEERGWILAYEDRVAALFVPAGSPLETRLRSLPRPALPPDGDGLSFP
jgi:hypothetical protein